MFGAYVMTWPIYFQEARNDLNVLGPISGSEVLPG